ncbi:MAG: hypothetical protein U0136_06845 [Bdellovibrionota bacterium]
MKATNRHTLPGEPALGAHLRRCFHTVLFCFAVFSFAFARIDTAAAQQPSSGIIEQTIAVPFRPVTVYALVSGADGSIQQYHAVAVPMAPGATEVEVGQTVTVGAVVPLPNTSAALEGSFSFTFFLVNLNGEFAATEVQSWTYKMLAANNRSISELDQDRAQIEHDIPLQREENNKLEARLTQVREQASKIAGVDDILDLKTELANLKDFDEKKFSDLERLHALYKAGSTVPDPKDVQDLRVKLLNQLRLAAQVTAEADRLGMSRQESALAEYKRKVDLVKSTAGEDPQALAKQILQLRKQRRELEGRLNLGAGGEQNGDF